MDLSANLDTSNVVGPAEKAASALREMKTAAEEAGFALAQQTEKMSASSSKWVENAKAQAEAAAKIAGTPAPSPSGAPSQPEAKPTSVLFNGGKSKFASSAGSAFEESKKKGDEESKKLNDKEEKAHAERRKREEAAAKSRAASLKSNKTDAMGVANFMKAGLVAGLAMGAAKIGIGGLGDLAKVAIGVRGMAKLDAITARTTLNFKRMFLGVDSSPLIRAADLFSKNFGPTTIMGRAIGDIFTRSFNGIFAAVEKLQPYLTAFGQGMVIAFLMAEIGIARAKAALQPYTGALDGIISSTTGMRVATILGGAALVTLAGYAVVAAAPFLALSAAILAVSAAFEQASKLAKEWDGDAFWNKVKSDLGINNQADTEKAMGITVGSDKDLAENGGKGKASGMAMGLGMVAGMDASGAAVEAAGKRMAANADRGVKTGADIHSPSRVFRKSGRFMGEGTALGMEDTKDRVQSAADKSLVPTPTLGPKVDSKAIPGAAKGGLQITGPLIQIQQLVVNGGEDLRLQVIAILESETQKAMDAIALKFPLTA